MSDLRKFRIKLNCAEITPGNAEHDVDEQFMQDLENVITLQDGSSINLNKAKLLYNPDTKQIELTDTDANPEGFIQVATLAITKDEPEEPMTEEEAINDRIDVETKPDTEGGAEDKAEGEAESAAPEMPAEGEDSGDFFQ